MDLAMFPNYNLSKLFPQEMLHHASGGACATSLGGAMGSGNQHHAWAGFQ